jgi:hypothetical protein
MMTSEFIDVCTKYKNPMLIAEGLPYIKYLCGDYLTTSEVMVSPYAFFTACYEVIEHCSQVVTTPASYLGGPDFKFQLGDQLS